MGIQSPFCGLCFCLRTASYDTYRLPRDEVVKGIACFGNRHRADFVHDASDCLVGDVCPQLACGSECQTELSVALFRSGTHHVQASTSTQFRPDSGAKPSKNN